jgi:glycosyltransferase involved in cell wall biosynthesis
MKTISIVTPGYNEEACIPALVEKIKETMDPLGYNYELVVVDDGSKDGTFELLKKLSETNPFVKGIRLSRNMGHQAALDCGLTYATGDAIICMDADLQHPPAMIPEMIRLWEDGYDVITTQKIENEEAGGIYKLMAKGFYYFFNKYSQVKLTPNASDFRLMSRKSLNALLQMPEYHKFFRGLVPYIGFKTVNLPFVVQKRHAGKRKYTFKKSMKLASDGLLSFSDFALKIPFYFGGLLLMIIFLYLVYALFLHFFKGAVFVQGWTSMIAILILSISIQLIFMGIMGIYIGKIFFEVKRRPVFFVDEVVGNVKLSKAE